MRSLPLAFKNRDTSKNIFTKHLQNLIRLPRVLFSNDMLDLTKAWITNQKGRIINIA